MYVFGITFVTSYCTSTGRRKTGRKRHLGAGSLAGVFVSNFFRARFARCDAIYG